jgi:hypothetical protein
LSAAAVAQATDGPVQIKKIRVPRLLRKQQTGRSVLAPPQGCTMTKIQKIQYQFLRSFLTHKNLPMLYAYLSGRMRENIGAGLDLGLSYEESYRMAAEDFFSLPAKMALVELENNDKWFMTLDPAARAEFHRLSIIREFTKNTDR